VPKKNITGFSMRHLKESTGTPRYDPWERTFVQPIYPPETLYQVQMANTQHASERTARHGDIRVLSRDGTVSRPDSPGSALPLSHLLATVATSTFSSKTITTMPRHTTKRQIGFYREPMAMASQFKEMLCCEDGLGEVRDDTNSCTYTGCGPKGTTSSPRLETSFLVIETLRSY